MRTRSALAAHALLGALALAAAPSRAQSHGPRADEGAVEREARAHFEAGLGLYAGHDYAAALAEFEASFRLRGVPVVVFNIAQSQRELRRYPDAIASYRRYLALAGVDLAQGRRDEVLATIDELTGATGALSVDSTPPGAAVRIDGRPAGTTPLAAFALADGSHTIELSRDGSEPRREDVTVVAGRTLALSYRLAPRATRAELAVDAREPGAVVSIDGERVGNAPAERVLAAGEHRVEVRAPGCEPYASRLVLEDGQRRTLDVALVRSPAFAARWYFWAGVGGAVAVAAVVTIVLVATQSGAGEVPLPGTGDPAVIRIQGAALRF